MEPGIVLLCIALIAVAYVAGRVGFAIENGKNEKSDYEQMSEAVDEAMKKEDRLPRNLLVRVLEDIGCQYDTDEDDTIVFKYQGETFQVCASNDSPYLWIYDTAWGQMKLSDPDAGLLRQALNLANQDVAVTCLYTTDKEAITVHCSMMIYFTGSIEKPGDYLRAILDAFFVAHRCVHEKLNKLKEGKKQRGRIEIKGFSPDQRKDEAGQEPAGSQRE